MKRYQTAVALRRALEDRLAVLAKADKVDLQQLRRRVAFDRFLCRLFQSADAPWLLKGGYAMELRIRAARTTRDIDLALRPLGDAKRGWDVPGVGAVFGSTLRCRLWAALCGDHVPEWSQALVGRFS